jgi:hypothetical protein
MSALATELPIYVESTAVPTESSRFRTVGPNSAIYATRWASGLVAMAGFLFLFGLGVAAGWSSLRTLVGALAAALVGAIVVRLVLRWRHRAQHRPDAFVSVAITTERLVCMVAMPDASPSVTVDRPRDELRCVEVGAFAPRWFLPSIGVLRFRFHDGTSLELLNASVGAEGVESALRLSGVAVQDLDGTPRVRPDFDQGAVPATRPKRPPFRARLLSCGLIGVVAGVSVASGLAVGQALPDPHSGVTRAVARQRCTPHLVRAVEMGDELHSVRFDAATSFGSGTLIVGSAEVEDALGEREVDFTCEMSEKGVRVALSD